MRGRLLRQRQSPHVQTEATTLGGAAMNGQVGIAEHEAAMMSVPPEIDCNGSGFTCSRTQSNW
ncbi:MAG: hypothetical protein M3Y41_14505 [Pseudomonadota bacterium]|nr:hypothetical protein [Pseudomonadota bacterium]